MIIDNLIELNTINKSDLLAEPYQVLITKTFVGKSGVKETGTMPNIGAVNVTLDAGQSYKPTLGYHNGQGTITAKTLAEQTIATAGQAQILAPYTAWVTGGKVTGTMVDRTGWTSSVAMNASVVIPQGYHDGTKSVTGPSITRMDGFAITPTNQTQTFQTANKYLNGNITCGAASVLPPEVVKKGYSYKVGDTTYVGTFQGYTDETHYLYNNGTVSSMIGSFNQDVDSSSSSVHKITFESTNIRMQLSFSSSLTYTFVSNTRTIDFSSYKYLNVEYYIEATNTDYDLEARILKTADPHSSVVRLLFSYRIDNEYPDPSAIVLKGDLTNMSQNTGFLKVGVAGGSGGQTVVRIRKIWLSQL